MIEKWGCWTKAPLNIPRLHKYSALGVTYELVETPAKKAAKSKPSEGTLEENLQNNYIAAMGEACYSDFWKETAV